jgi:hypothetical protein
LCVYSHGQPTPIAHRKTLQITSGINISDGATAVTHLQAPSSFPDGAFQCKIIVVMLNNLMLNYMHEFKVKIVF